MSIDRDTIINALHDVAKQYTPHTSDYLIQRFADRIMNEAAKARDTGSNAGMEAGDASPDEGIQRKQEGPVTRTSGDTTSPANHQPKDWRSMERLPVGEATTMLLSATADQPDDSSYKSLSVRIDDEIAKFCKGIGLKLTHPHNTPENIRWFMAMNIAKALPEREAGDPKEVRKFLLHHRLKYTLHGEDGLPLLDRLTPDGVMNTSLGWEEVDLLTEALFEHFDIRRRGSDD